MSDENHRGIMTLNSLNQNAEKLFSSFLSLTASLSSSVGYEKGKESKKGRRRKLVGTDHNFEITFPTGAGYVKLRHSFIADLGFYNANKMMWNDLGSDISRLAERHPQTGSGGNANPSATSEGESIKMRGIVVLIKLSLIFK